MPSYAIVEKKPDYEIRRHESFIAAETKQPGSHSESMSRGFNGLFRYISGDNVSRSKIKMTAHVLRSSGGTR